MLPLLFVAAAIFVLLKAFNELKKSNKMTKKAVGYLSFGAFLMAVPIAMLVIFSGT